MMTTYESALQNYRKALENIRGPGANLIERGGGGVSPTTGEAEVDDAVTRSQELRVVLSQALASDDADLRDVASLKLLASAAYDLALAEDLASASGEEDLGVERSASAVLLSPELKTILDAPLDATAFQQLGVIERAAFPTELAPARAQLRGMIGPFIQDIEGNSARAATRAIAGAVNFGLGPLQTTLSAATQEVLAKVPDGVSRFVGYAARLVQEAIRKLWEAFGQSGQQEIKDNAKNWFNKLLDDAKDSKNKSYAASLLALLYNSAHLKDEVVGMIDSAHAQQVELYKRSADAIDALSTRHARIISTLEWVVRAVGWAKAPLATVQPWGPLAAYAVYGGVVGYAVFSGGDYLDADRFTNKWLDHVVGLRTVVRSNMTG
jgi:hypothetical protein